MHDPEASAEMDRRAFLKLASLSGVGLAFGSFTSLFPAGCGPARPENQIRFALIGDYGETTPTGVFPVDRLAAMIKTWEPDFLISLGDINYEFGKADTIDANTGKNFGEFIFPKGTSPHADRYPYPADAPPHNRFFSILGNHDYDDPFSDLRPTPGNIAKSQPYVAYLAPSLLNGSSPAHLYPNTEGRVVEEGESTPRPFQEAVNIRFYDFQRGPVHFFCLDSNPPSPYQQSVDGTQGRWLKRRLAESEAVWKIVCFHHPPYASGVGAQMMEKMRWPFREWGADVVVSAHVHSYERLAVPDPGTISPTITYIVNGAGGFIPESGFDDSHYPGSLVRVANYGAQLVVADDESLTLLYYDIDNNLRDSFVLFRDGVTGPSEIEFEQPEIRADAAVDRVHIGVRRTGNLEREASVRYATVAGTAVAGTDFTPVSGELRFAPGESLQQIEVPVLQRSAPKPGLRFSLALSHPTRRTNLGFFRSLDIAIVHPALSPLRDTPAFVRQTFEDILYREPSEAERTLAVAQLGKNPTWLQKADWIVSEFFLKPDHTSQPPRSVAAIALLANANPGAAKLGFAQTPTRSNIAEGLRMWNTSPPTDRVLHISEHFNKMPLDYLYQEFPDARKDNDRFVALVYGYFLGLAAKPEDLRYWTQETPQAITPTPATRYRMLGELATRSFSPTPAPGMTPFDLTLRLRPAISFALLYAGIMREQLPYARFERKLHGAESSINQLADIVLGALHSAAYAKRFEV